MLCPVCKTQTLQMTERQGIEIDYCPGCRGVWLDRGELDKIIERSTAAAVQPAAQPAVQAQPQAVAQAAPPPVMHRDTRHLGQRPDERSQYGHGYKKKKKESFLSELFDF
ncbi:MAG: zf-TFIIB domain-containing protein [Stenotrophomonas sp.]